MSHAWISRVFLHLSVILFTGGVLSQHALQVVSQHALQGVCSKGGCLVPGRGAWSGESLLRGGLLPGGCLVWGVLLAGVPGGDPPDGYCCGRYASYWNAFLFQNMFICLMYIRFAKEDLCLTLTNVRNSALWPKYTAAASSSTFKYVDVNRYEFPSDVQGRKYSVYSVQLISHKIRYWVVGVDWNNKFNYPIIFIDWFRDNLKLDSITFVAKCNCTWMRKTVTLL